MSKYAFLEQSQETGARAFFDADSDEEIVSSRAMSNYIECPADYQCMKLRRESESVCCPLPDSSIVPALDEPRPQSSKLNHIPTQISNTTTVLKLLNLACDIVCEYLRDFSDRMEGTEAGMVLALPTPACHTDGTYEPIICTKKTIKVTRSEQRRILEEQNVRHMRALLSSQRTKRSTVQCPLYKCSACPHGYEVDDNGCQSCDCKREINAVKDQRPQRSVENLRLIRVDEGGEQLDVKSLIKYLRQNILAQSENSEANYMAEILSRKLVNQVVQERSAKVIDVNQLAAQSLEGAEKTVNMKRPHSAIQPIEDMLVSVTLDECYCVDGFGTEIPRSRGANVTTNSCNE